MPKLALSLVLILDAAAAQAQAPLSTPLPSGTYVFSDLCVGDHPWDIFGHRVELQHFGPDNDTIIITFSEQGANPGSINAFRTAFDPGTGMMSFDYQGQADEYSFDGKLTAKGLSGTFDDDHSQAVLPPVPSDAPVTPKCSG